MFNKAMLMAAGASPSVSYHGFRLQRHASNEATVITYKAADGTIKRMAVKDAKFRNVLKFGTYRTDVPELTNFTIKNSAGNLYIHGVIGTIPDQQPMPDTVTNDVIYTQWHASLVTDKTARENCDILMTYADQWDRATPSIKGVPAVEWCRSQKLSGNPCDLANEYELICIWACGDKLDEMDPTAANYPGLKLGYTATADYEGSVYGRNQTYTYNDNSVGILFSSTECNSNGMRGVYYYGGCHDCCEYVFGGVVPILELD